MLEGRAARLAAQRRTAPDLDRLGRALAQMRQQADDGEPVTETNRDFHLAVWHASHNPVLVDLLSGLAQRLDGDSELPLSMPAGAESALNAHELIYEAIAVRDPTLAEQLILDLLQTASPNREAVDRVEPE